MATCTTVFVADPTPDESAAEVSINSIRSPSPATIVADVTVTNTVTSGEGATVSPTVEATVNGGMRTTESVTLEPGSSVQITFEFTDTPTGSGVEVCVGVV